MTQNNTPDDQSHIDFIKTQHQDISDIIDHNFAIYNIIKSYIDKKISYDELKNSIQKFIFHYSVGFIINLSDTCNTDIGNVIVTLKLTIGEYVMIYREKCPYDILCDEMLIYCYGLRRLDAWNNPKITTCDPFAATLVYLNAGYNCGITDDGLKYCHRLKTLNAANNKNITTCEPFSLTLEELDASNECGIGDSGLSYCHKIKKLIAYINPYITTCEPFSKTLEILDASYHCGIDDNGIKNCDKLWLLHTEANPEISKGIE